MRENEFRMLLLARMEEKMVELMSREAYDDWFVRTSRDLLWLSVEHMEEGEYKNFVSSVLTSYDELTK